MDYYPDLYFVKLDGRTWYNATMKRVPAWLIPQPQMRHMEISTFDSPFSRLPLVDTVQRLGMMSRAPLSSLCLSGLNLYYDPIEASRRPSRSFDGLISLYLGELDPDAIEHLLDMCVFDNLMTLTLRDCAGVRPRIFDQISSIVGMLVLDKFAMTKNNSNPRAKVSHPHADMIHLLSNWHGIILSISASDASFDTVISALSKPTPVQQSLFPGESNLLCPNMQNLIVAACPSLTFDIFKKMIEKRNRKVNYHDPLWRQKDQEAPAITKLEIKFSWPKWTRQQMDWMKTRVADFQWLEY
ncbi:hypothetical protein CPB84DRAFT_833987 [Gymnopilus junonius]|uniref:Uncharacterized protein n=1 Tax=Gymnopilus junonius TaxID=109634 RepID=A0A9P5NN22_GYMJU|nr:hypothetical protein CPB84DRAFT_833987 [Gymnopilus junonius]